MAQQPVIRTYAGSSRRAAEEAYRLDAEQAAKAAWYPVAHRWSSGWQGHELAVVFEYRGESKGGDGFAPAASGEEGSADADEGPAPPASAPTTTAASGFGFPTATGFPAGSGFPAEGAIEPPEGRQPLHAVVAPAALEPTAAARSHARLTVETVDLHCAGEPLRLIRTGFPQIPDAPILERRSWVREHADHVRRALMYEPRGHDDMYGAVLLTPHRLDADIAVLFMHNEGYSTMCGHGTIAIATALVEERLYPVVEPVTTIRFEAPAGLVTAQASVVRGTDGGHEVRSVRFTNVPSYLHAVDLELRPEGVPLGGAAAERGTLTAHLAYGGAYYGIVDAADLGLRVVPDQIEALTRAGRTITDLLRRDHTPDHPTDPDLGFVYGTIIIDNDPATSPDGKASDADIRNVTIFADGEVDRSPCGSGTSAILATRFAQRSLGLGDELVNASITGESFRGRVEDTTTLGDRDAVVTSVEGTAFVTGYHTFIVDDRDPLGDGFLVR